MTMNLGKKIGKKLASGSIIALIGELGCGKTLLTRGIGAGLSVPERRVNSPTFVLVNEYAGRLPVFHMDLYRLESIEQGFEIGIFDYLARGQAGVIIIEWAEKVLSLLPEDYLKVELEVLAAKKRKLTISAYGPRSASLLKEISN